MTSTKRKRRTTKAYPGSLTKRGPATWFLRLCIGGKYKCYTVHGTKTDAQNYATEEKARLEKSAERVRVGLPVGQHFSDLLADYTTNALPTLAPGAQRSYTNCPCVPTSSTCSRTPASRISDGRT